MFNFFTISKDQNELGMEQENTTLAEKKEHLDSEAEAKKAVHGEDGVCCGGCGGS